MRLTHSNDTLKSSYTLGTSILKDTESFKDLGVTVSRDLTWSKPVCITVNKANKILGTIKRSVGTANTKVFSMLYNALVRPILEYAAPVWNPYLVKDTHAIEKVQRRASRLALRQKRGEMSYEERCQILEWTTLSLRRDYLSLLECYKIVFGLYQLNFSDFFKWSRVKSTRANHTYKLCVKASRVNCYKYSFFVRTIGLWNALPKYVLEANNFSAFKKALKDYLKI